MKFLSDRREIALAMNFGKYPVITMDIQKPKRGWDAGVYEGCKVRVDCGTFGDGMPFYKECSPMIFVDNYNEGIEDTIENRVFSKIELTCPGACLSNSFGASDVLEMAETANAPLLKSGQEVVVVYKAERDGELVVMVKMMKVGRVSRHCSTVATLEDID